MSDPSIQFRAGSYSMPNEMGGMEAKRLALRLLTDDTTCIKNIDLCLDRWQTEHAESILSFVRQNAHLESIEICPGLEDLSASQLAFASSIATAVQENKKITSFDLVLSLYEDNIEHLSRTVKGFLGAFTDVTLYIYPMPILEGRGNVNAHSALVEVAKEISLQKSLRRLSLEEIHGGSAIACSTLMSVFTTMGNWESLVELNIDALKSRSLFQLEIFLASCARNLTKLRINLDLDLDAYGTNELIFALKKSPKLDNLDLTTFRMDHGSMHYIAKYLASADCRLHSAAFDLGVSDKYMLESFHSTLIPSLASNTSISELEFCVDCIGSFPSEIVRDLLVSNRSLTALKIFWTRGHKLCPMSLAEAVSGNSTLKTLNLTGNGQSVHLSQLVETRELYHGRCGLEELTLSHFLLAQPEMKIPSFLKHFPSTLRSLHIYCKDWRNDGQLLGNILRSILTKSTLQRIDFGAMTPEAATSFSTIAGEVLPHSSNLTHLSFHLFLHSDDDAIKNNRQILHPLLKAITRNFSLVSLKIGILGEIEFDELFDTSLQQICLRNRVHKITKITGNAGMAARIVPRALQSIEKSCCQHHVDPRLQKSYTASLVHSALKTIPETSTMDGIFPHLRHSTALEGSSRGVGSKSTRGKKPSNKRNKRSRKTEGSSL